MIFLLGKLKRETPGSRNGERNNSWDSADQSHLLEIHKTFFASQKLYIRPTICFFASMDKKLLLLKVGKPTLANCRHSLKVFQMRRSSNVTSSGAADWRRLLWIFWLSPLGPTKSLAAGAKLWCNIFWFQETFSLRTEPSLGNEIILASNATPMTTNIIYALQKCLHSSFHSMYGVHLCIDRSVLVLD